MVGDVLERAIEVRSRFAIALAEPYYFNCIEEVFAIISRQVHEDVQRQLDWEFVKIIEAVSRRGPNHS